ncbi:unannotated protein [freshwater metagenome]|uniref:Unannotated protein n=1 Tax=freshwater metagenome TaxID=449393 RepID=A0A6J6TNU6_9ZZZZ
MYVHAVTGFLEKRLSHKGGVDSMFLGNRTHYVFEVDRGIRHLEQGAVPQINLGLARAIFHVPGLNFNTGLAKGLANIKHEVIHLSATCYRIAVYVVIQRLPLIVEKVAFKFGRTMYREPSLCKLRQLLLEHVASIHLDWLIRTRVHGVAHNDGDALGPAGHSKTRQIGHGMHIGKAILLIDPRSGEDEASWIPAVNNIGDRVPRAPKELTNRDSLSARDAPGVNDHALHRVNPMLLAERGNTVALSRLPAGHQASIPGANCT